MTQLRLEGLGRTYPAAVPVQALRGATLTIHQGDFVAIEGPSGAGKSTLLNLLALLDSPTSGSYLIDGCPTAGLSDSEAARTRAHTFGFIFQSFHLIAHRSALENVMLGMAYQGSSPAQARQQALQALEFVGLSPRSDMAVGQLSGGERQRVAIARAVSAGAPVLLADEPTGNLDTASSSAIMDLLQALSRRGTTVVVVTHDPLVAARARRRIRVVDGRVSEAQADGLPALAVCPPAVTDPVPCAPRGPECEGGSALLLRPARVSEELFRARADDGLPAGGDPDVAAGDGVSNMEGRRPSHVAWPMMLHDVVQALVTEPGRMARLVGVVLVAVMLTLTMTGLAYSARYQVSDTFDAQRNRRVAVGVTEDGQETGPAQVADQPDRHGLERVAAVSGVEEVMALSAHGDVSVTTDPRVTQAPVPLYGVTAVTDLPHLLTVQDGALGMDLRAGLGRGQALVGVGAAAKIGLGPLDGSPTIWVDGAPYEVAGLVSEAGVRPELLSAVILSQEQASEIDAASDAGIEVWVRPGAAQGVGKVVAAAWLPTLADHTTTVAPPDPQAMRAELESNVRTILLTLTLVAVLAGLLTLSSAMNTAVQARQGELALRRAMGARRVHLRVLIAGEAVLVGLVGGILGSVGGVLAVLAVTILQRWQPVLEPLSVPLGLVVGVCTGLVASLLAARRASCIDPAVALR
ncbi:ATP-binding cassette domain-containing protein [Actinomyces faecalis]|uniref:ATP-binding cassette domain-containing protein n=1 Tax=Actinomyces faecalis TaxID=2722820 RepID=UPI001551BA9A|nr:ATP-binding cassette domain-containing protein [Actinomyces faecalis]